jgi:hypothetical protein
MKIEVLRIVFYWYSALFVSFLNLISLLQSTFIQKLLDMVGVSLNDRPQGEPLIIPASDRQQGSHLFLFQSIRLLV